MYGILCHLLHLLRLGNNLLSGQCTFSKNILKIKIYIIGQLILVLTGKFGIRPRGHLAGFLHCGQQIGPCCDIGLQIGLGSLKLLDGRKDCILVGSAFHLVEHSLVVIECTVCIYYVLTRFGIALEVFQHTAHPQSVCLGLVSVVCQLPVVEECPVTAYCGLLLQTDSQSTVRCGNKHRVASIVSGIEVIGSRLHVIGNIVCIFTIYNATLVTSERVVGCNAHKRGHDGCAD